MDIRQLQYFQVCARQKSLTRAAEILYTTQPHVSMVIRSLEQELGVKLFLRRSKGVELTEEGKEIYEYAVNILKNVNLITSSAGRSKRTVLKIATNPSSTMAVLLSRYAAAREKDDIQIIYTECGIEKMISLVSEQKYELGFLFAAENKRSALSHMLDRKRLEFVQLLLSDIVLYVGPRHPLYGTEYVTPQDLEDLRFVQLEDDYFALSDMLEKMLPPGKRGKVMERAVITNSDHAMMQLLRNTGFCNLGSYWNVSYEGEFARIPIRGYEEKVAFGFIRQSNSLPNGRAEEFLSFVRNMI
ncbi:MAG: LysR family transcriptional regulator [Ruminococcus sp.]